jgi:hypothetical protein
MELEIQGQWVNPPQFRNPIVKIRLLRFTPGKTSCKGCCRAAAAEAEKQDRKKRPVSRKK